MSGSSEVSVSHSPLGRWLAVLLPAAALWVYAYLQLPALADAIVRLAGFARDTRLGEALHFFFYDTPKVLLLLAAIGKAAP